MRVAAVLFTNGLDHANDVAALELLHSYELGGIVTGDEDMGASVRPYLLGQVVYAYVIVALAELTHGHAAQVPLRHHTPPETAEAQGTSCRVSGVRVEARLEVNERQIRFQPEHDLSHRFVARGRHEAVLADDQRVTK